MGEVGKLVPQPLPTTGRSVDEAQKGKREVDYATDGVHLARIYDGSSLEPGMHLRGPAIIETKGTTVVVHPGTEARVDVYGNLVLKLGEPR
jgi:N-methylhydantoinase A